MAEGRRRPREHRELSNREYVVEFVRLFGPFRSFQLLGWMSYWELSGRPTLGSVIKAAKFAGTARPAVYRFLADIQRFRARVAELEGRELEPVEGLDELLQWFHHRVHAEAAAAHTLAPGEREVPLA